MSGGWHLPKPGGRGNTASEMPSSRIQENRRYLNVFEPFAMKSGLVGEMHEVRPGQNELPRCSQ